jgi:hypothetical protein
MKDSDYAFRVLNYYIKDIEGTKEEFSSSTLKNLYNLKNGITTQSLLVERVLRRVFNTNYCVRCLYPRDKFCLYRYTLMPTQEQYEYLYHSSNVSPSVILTLGLKPHYSLNSCKAHSPLIFLSTDGGWPGRYKYKVRVKQPLYFDTNLNHLMKKGNNNFCVKNFIDPNLITLSN